jgi:squalene-associated FAD-dependent desaturase
MELARGGAQVTLFEAARTLGGRARRIAADGRTLDNGQHILLGAYKESLRLMKMAGIDTRSALLNLPLQMRYPEGSGMDFLAPRLPAPFHLAIALLRARGLDREDRLSLARFSTTARWMGWQLDKDCSVSELLERYDQTPRLITLMWRPLCLAALNTPPERASAKVFLAVLRDSLGARRAASDMLLPRVDLSALFPDAAAAWLRQRGATVHEGAKVGALRAEGARWRVAATGAALGEGREDDFDGVVLATSPLAAASLLPEGLAPLQATLTAFEAEPITTCYLQYEPSETLPLPFCALQDDPAQARWGQFVFDRGQLDPSQKGLFAMVVSASGGASELPQQELAALLAGQLAAVFGRPALAQPAWSRVVTEKRATFACTPGLQRPANDTGLPGLWLAGDYTAGEYPATIEMAVRSGIAAARGLLSGGAR